MTGDVPFRAFDCFAEIHQLSIFRTFSECLKFWHLFQNFIKCYAWNGGNKLCQLCHILKRHLKGAPDILDRSFRTHCGKGSDFTDRIFTVLLDKIIDNVFSRSVREINIDIGRTDTLKV